MTTDTLILCLLSSTVAAATVTAIKELYLWRLNRKAKIEDKDREDRERLLTEKLEIQFENNKKILEKLDIVEKKVAVSCRSNKVILQNLIKTSVLKHIEEGEVTFEDRKLIHEMWNIYHYGLEGNGDLDDVMEMFDELPIKM